MGSKKLFPVCIFSFCILFISLFVSCRESDTELIALEEQVQIEAADFELLMDEFGTYLSSITDPCDVDIMKLIPDNWLFEIYKSDVTGKTSYALAVPVPKDLIKGLTYKKVTDEKIYLDRGGNMNPNTNLYLASYWTGKPYDWGILLGVNDEMRKYPVAVKTDYFKSRVLLTQPYMIPPEASHGVYTGDWSYKYCTVAKLVDMASVVKNNSPYRLSMEGATDNRTYTEALELLKSGIKKVQEDATGYLNFVTLMNNNFFSKSMYVYSNGDELGNYIKQMTEIKEKVAGTQSYISRLDEWDFSKLVRYDELRNTEK